MKSEMYTTHAERYDAAARSNIYNAYLERPSLLALMDEVKGSDLLDLGCGSGIYAEHFIENGVKSLTCIDLSEEMIALVRGKLGDKVTAYAQSLAEGLPREKDNSFDVVVCPLVLHYIEDLKPVFAEIQRVLKPGGYLVFSTHHPFVDFEVSVSGNYFDRELIHEEWNTIGEPVAVSFYRRSLTEFFDAITASGLVVSALSEGQVSDEAKTLCEETWLRLKTNPNFIFIRAQKC